MNLAGSDLLARLLDCMPTPVIVADLRGRLVLVNGAMERALGYRVAEAQEHLHVTDLYHRLEEARQVLARLREQAVDGHSPAETPFDITLRARTGELVPVRLTASLLRDAAGTPIGSVGVFEDRRAWIALDRRLEDAAGQVEASERRAAGAASVGAAVHEMSQPLTAAMGNVEMLLLDEGLPEAARARLDRTYDQLERLRGNLDRLARVGRRAPKGSAGEGDPG